MEWIESNIMKVKEGVFYLLCWISGTIFLRIGCKHIDLDKPDEVHLLFLIFISVGLLLLLLPFFKKVKFGSVSLERDIQQTKQEVSDLRTEVRQQFTLISANLNTISNNNKIIVNNNLPQPQEIKAETSIISKQLPNKEKEVEEISEELILPYEDKLISLIKVRIRIEYLLRKILEKRLSYTRTNRPMKFLPLGELIKRFFKEYPQYSYMQRSFDFVNQITLAAIHAQNIEDKQIDEVLQLGATLIASLDQIG